MRPYPRPLLKSSRVRHFAAGAGVILGIVALSAATGVGTASQLEAEGIMNLQVDVRDVPCDEPWNPDERVQVIPDTLDGRIQVQVIVRNRECCCCEGEGPLGQLRTPRSTEDRTPTTRTPRPETSSITPEPEDVTPRPEVKPRTEIAMNPLAPRTSSAFSGTPSDVTAPASTYSRAKLPWWLALAAAPAAFVLGREDRPPGGICENDETGANSGPSRTGCWPRVREAAS